MQDHFVVVVPFETAQLQQFQEGIDLSVGVYKATAATTPDSNNIIGLNATFHSMQQNKIF